MSTGRAGRWARARPEVLRLRWSEVELAGRHGVRKRIRAVVGGRFGSGVSAAWVRGAFRVPAGEDVVLARRILAGVGGFGVRRVDFGYFVRPADETGTGVPRVEPCLGYLVEHSDGLLLVDTGMGRHPEVDAWYRPRRVALGAAVAAAGATLEQIRYVVNCHLHFDHCGGNPELAGRPVFAQRVELATARTTSDYTLPELIDHSGARYEELDGAAEILPGVRIVPTPGHTAGHQSVVVRRADGTAVVAGQSHDNATLFTGDVLARRAGMGAPPEWLDTLLALDPKQVFFAHDNAIWTP